MKIIRKSSGSADTSGLLSKSANLSDLANKAAARQNLNGGSSVRIVFEGDSIFASYSIPDKVAALSYFTGRTTFYNVATSGHDIAAVAMGYNSQVFPLRPAANGGGRTILVVLAGTNDTDNAANQYAALAAYWTQAKADGFEVWACTLTPRTGQLWRDLNNLIRKSSIPNKIIDLALSVKNPADTAIFADGLHPTPAGADIIAQTINAAAWSESRLFSMANLGDMASQSSTAVVITGGSAIFREGFTVFQPINGISGYPKVTGQNTVGLVLDPNGDTQIEFYADAAAGTYGIKHFDGSQFRDTLKFTQGSSMLATFGGIIATASNQVRIATAKTPSSATDTGTTGSICWDANYIYACVAANTWKRTAISTW